MISRHCEEGSRIKVLIIGGTGNISSAVTALLSKQNLELYLLNRGSHTDCVPQNVKIIRADINDYSVVKAAIERIAFDAVADFIAYTKEDVIRDYSLFSGKTKQYIFISTASAYQKPPLYSVITENTPLANPFWRYSRDKIECENFLMKKYRENGFPVTVVRPSHTYGDLRIPVALHGKNGPFQVLSRIRVGKKVIVPGDGNSLWTVTHNSDFAKGFAGLVGNTGAIGQAYHITSDEVLTWNRIYEIIGVALGVKVKLVHIPTDTIVSLHEEFRGSLYGDKSNSVIFDNTKIKNTVPGFNAEVSFEQGAQRTVNYIYSHRQCRTPDPEFDIWCDSVIDGYEKCLSRLPKF